MRGMLSETSVADLCRRLADAGATGTLEVEHPAGQGRLSFVDGRLVWAEPPTAQARLGDRLVHAGLLSRDGLEEALEAQAASGSPRRLGAVLVERGLVARDSIRVYVQEQILDALVELSLRSEGAYTFTSTGPPREALPADLLVGDALAVVSRRQEEWGRIRQVIPGPDAVPRPAGPTAVDPEHLEPDDLAVLGVLDGRHSIRQVAVSLGFGTYEAARVIYGLVLQGLVEVEAAEPPAAPAGEVDLDDEEFARLLEELAEEAHGTVAGSRRPDRRAGADAPATPDAGPPERGDRATGDAVEPVGAAPDEGGEELPPGSGGSAEAEAEPPAPPEPRPPRTRSGDVSEFLRELSQLAVDDEDRDG